MERQADKLLDRIMDADLPSVIKAYENKIKNCEEEKLLIAEKIANCGKPLRSFEQTL